MAILSVVEKKKTIALNFKQLKEVVSLNRRQDISIGSNVHSEIPEEKSPVNYSLLPKKVTGPTTLVRAPRLSMREGRLVDLNISEASCLDLVLAAGFCLL